MDRKRGYSDEDMAEVSDSPEWTADEFTRSKPFAEAFPDLAESLTRGNEIVARSAVWQGGMHCTKVEVGGD